MYASITFSFPLTLWYSPKAMPWFVSDVTPSDFSQTISILQSDQWFIDDPASHALKVIAQRFQQRLDSGVFALSVPLDSKLGEPLTHLVRNPSSTLTLA